MSKTNENKDDFSKKSKNENSLPVQSFSSPSEEVRGENLDRVRDILFGTQVQNIEEKIVQLNDNFLKEIDNLRDETKRRFDSLETYVKKFEDQTSKTQRELRQKILDQSKNLRAEIFSKSEEISAALLKAVQEIRRDMTERMVLAEFLKKVAADLEKEPSTRNQEK